MKTIEAEVWNAAIEKALSVCELVYKNQTEHCTDPAHDIRHCQSCEDFRDAIDTCSTEILKLKK